jgi:hypothetical protein
MAMDLVTLVLTISRNKYIRDSIDEFLMYGAFIVILCFGSKLFSDGTFSARITLGAAVQGLGFCLLRLKIRKQRSVEGISSRTLQMYAVAYMCRLYSTLQYNGYLPIDKSGDWAYQLCDVVALLVVLSVLFAIHGKYESSYEKDKDTCAIHICLALCFALAYLIHPHLNNRAIPDMAWTAGLYLEALAMVPQLFMMAKKGGEVETLASHYIACCFICRLLYISFWVHSYTELLPKGSTLNVPGMGVIGAQVLQVVLFGDFMYYYVKGLRFSRMTLPGSISV